MVSTRSIRLLNPLAVGDTADFAPNRPRSPASLRQAPKVHQATGTCTKPGKATTIMKTETTA
jgi:hypothetical protein